MNQIWYLIYFIGTFHFELTCYFLVVDIFQYDVNFLNLEQKSMYYRTDNLENTNIFVWEVNVHLLFFVSSSSRDGKLEAFILAKPAHLSSAVPCLIWIRYRIFCRLPFYIMFTLSLIAYQDLHYQHIVLEKETEL